MSLYDELKGGFAELHAGTGFGEPCTINEEEVLAVMDAERTDDRFDSHSERELATRNCVVLKSALIARPPDRGVVFVGANEYVITKVGEDSIHYLLTLEKRT